MKKKMVRLLSILLTGGMFIAALSVTAQAAPTSTFPLTGEIERLTVNNDNGIYSSGVMVVGGHEVILPKNLLIDLPANRLTLKQIFAQAPAACVALGESGLAKADKCNTMGSGGNATISANRTNAGNNIAGDVFIQKGVETVTGQVTFINYTDGYYRLNGASGSDNTGVMVRLNDPTSHHTVQQGLGCAAGNTVNCSADPRFTLDPDNYVNTFTTGYPYCIPSTLTRQFPGLPAIVGIPVISAGPTQAAADGSGDLLCPSTNRSPGAVSENPVADSRRFAPVIVGDSVTAEGNFETVGGVRFLSAHTTKINKALQTRNSPDQPDYLFLDEVFIDGPAYQNQRVRTLIIGYTTLAPTDVDFWTIHRDPVNNAIHEFPFASVQGCDTAAGAGTCGAQGLGGGAGNNIFRIRYDVDFNLPPAGVKDAKLSPCAHLNASRFALNCFTMADQFAVLSPIPHEIQSRTGHRIVNPGLANVTIDVNGNPATNGQYLFPFGINLGGIDIPNFFEIDLNLINTPTIFEGLPWNLDRRLGPGGCLDDTGAPGPCPSGPAASFALDPFPFSALDPRTQAPGMPAGSLSNTRLTASPLTSVRDRIFSYVVDMGGNTFKFNGNSTVLPYQLGTFPPDPGPIAINPTPALSIFPPIADEDAATTAIGVPVTIDVTANDFPILGAIDPASVKIDSGPASGSAVVNLPAGTITYTPTPAFQVGTVTFTYTVADNSGSVSLPGTVTVTIVSPSPAAVNDVAATTTGTPIAINVLANDTISAPGVINAAALAVTAPTGAVPPNTLSGSAAANPDGTVTYTPPATAGTYTFTYTVQNSALPPSVSNAATVTVTVTPAAPPAPATGVGLFSTVASPQVASAAVSFNAAASGGTGSYEYQYWLKDTSGAYTLVQPFSPSPTWNWNTTGLLAGTYSIAAQARSVGSTTPGFDAETVKDFFIIAGVGANIPATAVNITTNLASPQAAGAPVTFTGTASGGSGFYEYQFWLKDTAGVYTLVQPFSASQSWTWNTTGAVTGAYTVAVQARSLGTSPPNGFDVETTAPFAIQ